MISSSLAVPLERLRWRCDPTQLGFETTAEVPPLEHMVGQDRGLRAIELALELDTRGYNVYVAGPSGTGRTSTVSWYVSTAAARRPTPGDWCYLHNFESPYRPIAIQLPSGRGPELARDMDQLVTAFRREIPRAFESEQFEQRRAAIVQELDARREALFNALREAAQQLGFMIQITPAGIISVPLLAPGQPLTPEGFELLPPAKKAEIRTKGQELQRRADETILAVRRLEREAHEQLHALQRQVALFAVGHLIDTVRAKWADFPPVLRHLDAVQTDLIEHLDELRASEREHEAHFSAQVGTPWDRYRVNVLVSNQPDGGAPVIFEPNPTYYNLVGRIDYRASIGAMYTDFTLIKPGALHRANGGFLVLQARDVLLSPFAWDVLKRSLRDGEVRIENLGEQLSAFPTATLKPEPIPLRVKVVLIGDLFTYMLLYRLDEDFRKLFKVKAHFGPAMDRLPDTIQAYAAFVSGQVRLNNLLPVHRDAVARIVEHGARLAEHQQRLATRFNAVSEIVLEADHWARREGADVVRAEHVERAIAEQEHRANLIEEEVQRLIDEGTLAIDTESNVVGQVNGLSVTDLGDYAFARPSRITASVGLGAEGVVNIEREAELSGRVHSKGVLILSGYLLRQYAHERPLAVSARLAFEQVYDEIDGDSASSAELYALLSSLADLPVKQGIAVTGSVNQRGEVQAVGAVTTKIEGFFAVCKARGLTGEQGVVIPAANVRHLMLKQEVIDAVAAGRFHIWAVQTVDEGIELLTGVPAGMRRADGTYPPDTVHGRVQRRLHALATRLAEFADRRRLVPIGPRAHHDGGHARPPTSPGRSYDARRRAARDQDGRAPRRRYPRRGRHTPRP
jgi:lon-related putative ATP-dependent protease